MVKIITRLSYTTVFDDKINIDKLVNQTNQVAALTLLATINKFEYKIHKSSDSEIKFILHEWITGSDTSFKKQVVNAFIKHNDRSKLTNPKKLDFSSASIINRATTLRMIEIFLSKKACKSNKNIEFKDNAENLFKIYLLVSDEISERQDKVFKKWFSKNILDNEKQIRLHLYFGLTQVDITNELINKRLIAEVFKFILFEKWSRKQEEYFSMLSEYLKTIGEANWYEYFNKIFLISRVSVDNYILSTKNNSEIKSILNFFSKRNEIENSWNELLEIRKNPLFMVNSYEFLILDYLFLINKIFSGIYHDLIQISKSNVKNNFHLDYSKYFAEEYLLLHAIKLCFGDSYIQFSEQKIKSQNSTRNIENLSLPDYYIRNGNKLLLFEFKNSFLSNTKKINLNFDDIEFEIKEKFFYNKKKKKAISQLVGFIKNTVAEKYLFFDKIPKVDKVRFYPILVVTDYTLCSIAFNKLFNEYFNLEASKLGKKTMQKTNPITIIHIDDFLYYNSYLKKLDTLIEQYHKYVKNINNFDSMVSFSFYLDSEKFKDVSPLKKVKVDEVLKDSLLPN